MKVFKNNECFFLLKSLTIVFSEFKVLLLLLLCVCLFVSFTLYHKSGSILQCCNALRYNATSPQKVPSEEYKFCITESMGYDWGPVGSIVTVRQL